VIKPALDIRPGKRHRLTLCLQRSMQIPSGIVAGTARKLIVAQVIPHP
ncbi:uncharacterized protein METZ01_LOCUS249293, partial [marine metagenome]